MADAALASAGGRVIMATCYDERHPPEMVIDGREDTFWITTGMFPQELVVALPAATDVTRVTTVTAHVRKIVVETCDAERPSIFNKAIEAELSNVGSRAQTETHQVSFRAKYVKIVFESGYDTFAGLNKVSIITKSDKRMDNLNGEDDAGLGAGRGGYNDEDEDDDF